MFSFTNTLAHIPRSRRTTTIIGMFALGTGGVLLGGCGGAAVSSGGASGASVSSRSTGSTASITQPASTTAPQAASTAQSGTASTTVPSSTAHAKAPVRSAHHATSGSHSPEVTGVSSASHLQTAQRPAQRESTRLVPHGPNPCVFVSGAEAQAIIGTPIAGETEAPLGPTCVFTLKGQRQTITIAVETQPLQAQVRYMHRRRHLVLGGHRAYCGVLGRPMLDVSLGAGRILNVTAPCSVAQALAARALRHIAA